MGNFCGTNLYSQIKQAHPKDFQKCVIGEEMKGILRDKVMSAEAKLIEAIHQNRKKDLLAISCKERQVQQHYTHVKEQVDKCYLGGLKGLQQAGFTSTDDIFCYHAIQARFQSLKQDVTSKFTENQFAVRDQLIQITKQWQKIISLQQPKVQMYDQLPLKLKRQVYNSCVKEYCQTIKLQSTVFLSPLNQKLSVQHYTQKFTNLLPSPILQAITEQSKQKLDKQLLNLIGNPCESHAFLS